jgi:Tripartite tricarboxylate transporter family receptor
MLPLVAALPQAEAGRLRMLAVANPVRSPAAPKVPTAAEAYFPELSFEARLGSFGPRSMPAELRERTAADVRAVAADHAFGERLKTLGMAARLWSEAAAVGQPLNLRLFARNSHFLRGIHRLYDEAAVAAGLGSSGRREHPRTTERPGWSRQPAASARNT